MIKREISDHFDVRASNPVHVNNIRGLFGGGGGGMYDSKAGGLGSSYADIPYKHKEQE